MPIASCNLHKRNMFTCELCHRVYHTTQSLQKHKRHVHAAVLTEQCCVICELCGHEFESAAVLRRHQKLEHEQKEEKGCRLNCSFIECEVRSTSYKCLRNHLLKNHGVEVEEQKFDFNSKQEFDEWKEKEEKSKNVLFVLDSGVKRLSDGSRRMYYYCHRSHTPRHVEVCQRHPKNRGSSKRGTACPSNMIVTIREKHSVHYFCTHVGHNIDLGHLPIAKTDKDHIAGRLAEGVPMQKILGDFRNAALEDANSKALQRINLLERKDLHNIKRDYNITYSMRYHENDALSVKLWVKKMEISEKNPVLYFKELGQKEAEFLESDFILIIMTDYQEDNLLTFGKDKICIDGTHGLTNYNFQLYTLLVVDGYGTGIPVAFCFSNREDTSIFTFFFEKIKEKVGEVRTHVFMSDDFPGFYNAWLNVMGAAEHQLLCSWHVQKNWFKNLCKIKGENAFDARSSIFKTLKVLQRKNNPSEFKEEFVKFVNYLKGDDNTKDFANYMMQNYGNRTEKWAYCFRPYLGINTNNHLESLHKKLKYSYLEGKKCRRLDKSLNAVFDLVRDIAFQSLIRIQKSKLTNRIQKIRESHNKSLDLDKMPVKVSVNQWMLESSENSSNFYIIERVKSMAVCICGLRCTECKICVHEYRCSCPDSQIYINICKHIHAVVQGEHPASHAHEPSVAVFKENPLQHFPKNRMVSEEHGNIEITSRCEIIIGLAQRASINETGKQEIVKKLDCIISKLNQGEINFSGNDVSRKRTIDSQPRFVAKNNKRRPKLPAPSRAETEVINKSLQADKNEIVYIHDTFDHMYTKLQ